MRRLSLIFAVAAVTLAAPREALACACCSNQGQRNVNVEALDQSKRALLEKLRFADGAKLYLGEADPDSVEGIANPSSAYALEAAWEGNRLVFALKDEHGNDGTLALELPNKISVFEVDPRDAPDQGTGPALYKEWKLSGRTGGSGVFAPGAAAGHTLTLIVQGRGNSCTSASDFAYWTLVMQGPKEALALPKARDCIAALLRRTAEALTDKSSPAGCLLVQGVAGSGEHAKCISDELCARRAENEKVVRERLKRAKTEGDLPKDADPAALARFVATVTQGMAVQAAGGASRTELRRVAETALRAFP